MTETRTPKQQAYDMARERLGPTAGPLELANLTIKIFRGHASEIYRVRDRRSKDGVVKGGKMNEMYTTGWTSGKSSRPPTQEEIAAFEEAKRKANAAWAEVEAEQRKLEIREITKQYDEQVARVADLQKRFDDALAHEPSDLIKWQFSQLFDEKSSLNDRARAQVWIQQRDDTSAYEKSGFDGDPSTFSTCTLWALLEKAKTELAKKHRPAGPAPVKVESAFVQAICRARTEDDLLDISDIVLESALDDLTDWREDQVLASYIRLFPESLVCKTLGQVASRILSRKRRRLIAQAETSTKGE